MKTNWKVFVFTSMNLIKNTFSITKDLLTVHILRHVIECLWITSKYLNFHSAWFRDKIQITLITITCTFFSFVHYLTKEKQRAWHSRSQLRGKSFSVQVYRKHICVNQIHFYFLHTIFETKHRLNVMPPSQRVVQWTVFKLTAELSLNNFFLTFRISSYCWCSYMILSRTDKIMAAAIKTGKSSDKYSLQMIWSQFY